MQRRVAAVRLHDGSAVMHICRSRAVGSAIARLNAGDMGMLATEAKDQLKHLRVDQVGSLGAPPRLQQVFERYKRGTASEDELTQEKDRAIRHLIERQEAI